MYNRASKRASNLTSPHHTQLVFPSHPLTHSLTTNHLLLLLAPHINTQPDNARLPDPRAKNMHSHLLLLLPLLYQRQLAQIVSRSTRRTRRLPRLTRSSTRSVGKVALALTHHPLGQRRAERGRRAGSFAGPGGDKVGFDLGVRFDECVYVRSG
ncbi:hypothetical protein BKA81DRAFT_351583 [Phyllosticta paracitricarpa]